MLNEEKKFLTNAICSDFFVTAARTDKYSLSLFLLVREMKSIQCRCLTCKGRWVSETTFIFWVDVHVPDDHMIGIQNEVFKYIIYKFKNED